MTLKAYLQHQNLSTKQAAQQLGLSRVHLHSIVTGRITAGKKLAIKIQRWSNGNVKYSEIMFTEQERRMLELV